MFSTVTPLSNKSSKFSSLACLGSQLVEGAVFSNEYLSETKLARCLEVDSLEVVDNSYSVVLEPELGIAIANVISIKGAKSFTFDFSSQTLVVELDNYKPEIVKKIYLELQLADRLAVTKGDCIDLSIQDFLYEWNVQGAISGTLGTFEGHGSLSLSFYICKAQYLEVRKALPNNTRVSLLGRQWHTSNIGFAQSEDRDKLIVSLSLKGINDSFGDPACHPVDERVSLVGGMFGVTPATGSCGTGRASWRSINSFESAKYIGKPFFFKVPPNSKFSDTTSLRDQVTSARARTLQGYLYNSNPEGLEIRTWGEQKIHYLSDADVTELKSNISTPGEGKHVNADCIQLSKEYHNAELTVERVEKIKDDDKDRVVVRWEFENARSLYDCQSPATPIQTGNNIYITKNPNRDILRNPAIAFDASGLVKTAHRIESKNGVETSRLTKKFGYIVDSTKAYRVVSGNVSGVEFIDSAVKREGDENSPILYQFHIIFSPGGSPASYWREVESSFTLHHYTSEGYRIRSVTTGRRLARRQTDGSNLDGIRKIFSAKINEADADILADQDSDDSAVLTEIAKLRVQAEADLEAAKTYTFDRTDPIQEKETFTLNSFRFHYSDANRPDGSSCDWVEPRFAKNQLKSSVFSAVEENPGSTDDKPLPPLVRGYTKLYRKDITVTESRSPSQYVQTESTITISGDDFSRSADLNNLTEQQGRPSVHQKITKRSNKGSFGGENAPKTKGYFDYPFGIYAGDSTSNDFKYILNTPGDRDDDFVRGTVSFPDIYSYEVGLLAAQTDISILNTKGAEILSLETLYQQDWQEGDFVIYQGNKYVLLSMGLQAVEVDGRSLRGKMQISLGRFVNPVVRLTRINTNNQLRTNAPRLGLYAVDGNVGYLKDLRNNLTAEQIAALEEAGLLEEYAENAGLKLQGEGDFESSSGIDDFLGSGASSLDQGSFSPSEIYLALLERFNALQAFDQAFRAFLAQFGQQSEQSSSSGDGEGSGGGGSDSSSSGSSTSSDRPIKVEGGKDKELAKLLTSLLNFLKDLIELFTDPLRFLNVGSFGGGSGSVGGGGGGDAGGGGGGSGESEGFDLDKFLQAFEFGDPDAIFAEILALIAQLLELVQNFDIANLLTILNNIDSGSSGGGTSGGVGGGGTSSSSGGGSSGSSGASSDTEDLEPIVVTLPESFGFDSLDFDLLFAKLDELLAALDIFSNGVGFDFNSGSFLDLGSSGNAGSSSASSASSNGLVGGGLAGDGAGVGNGENGSFAGNAGEFGVNAPNNNSDGFGGATAVAGTENFALQAQVAANLENYTYYEDHSLIISELAFVEIQTTAAIENAIATDQVKISDQILFAYPPGYALVDEIAIAKQAASVSEQIVRNVQPTTVIVDGAEISTFGTKEIAQVVREATNVTFVIENIPLSNTVN